MITTTTIKSTLTLDPAQHRKYNEFLTWLAQDVNSKSNLNPVGAPTKFEIAKLEKELASDIFTSLNKRKKKYFETWTENREIKYLELCVSFEKKLERLLQRRGTNPKFTKADVIKALDKNNWKRKLAAQTLGVSERTLYRYMNSLIITEDDNNLNQPV